MRVEFLMPTDPGGRQHYFFELNKPIAIQPSITASRRQYSLSYRLGKQPNSEKEKNMAPNLQFLLPVLFLFGSIAGSIRRLSAFTSFQSPLCPQRHSITSKSCDHSQLVANIPFPKSESLRMVATKDEESVKVNDLLSDLPTPTLLIELSLAESALNHTSISLDEYLGTANSCAGENLSSILDGSIFVHTQITDTSVRDEINKDKGSGKSPVIGRVDVCSQEYIPGGAFLGIGLSNHHVGGYYWARGMGIGASLEAHGVAFRDVAETEDSSTFDGGELYWTKRDLESIDNDGSGVLRGATTENSSNSNDGKRSEWADFLVRGDTVQLIPYDTTKVLFESGFQRIIGVRRMGRPLGADPIVERVWKRSSVENGDGKSWVPL